MEPSEGRKKNLEAGRPPGASSYRVVCGTLRGGAVYVAYQRENAERIARDLRVANHAAEMSITLETVLESGTVSDREEW